MVSYPLLERDARHLYELWSGKRPGSGIEAAKRQTLRLLSVHEDRDRRIVTKLIAERFTDDEERKAFLSAVSAYLRRPRELRARDNWT